MYDINDNVIEIFDDDMMDLIDGKISLSEQKEKKNKQLKKDSSIIIQKQELILFFGPPCSGKTEYYNQEYKETHTYISPPELYKTKKNFSFHRLINLVISYLQKGKNIVIDDENRLVRTRKSILKPIKQLQEKGKLLNLNIIAICFNPLGGIKQCLWANEWAMAEHYNSNNILGKNLLYSPKSNSDFEEWYNFGESHIPSKDEGFNEIKTITSKIHCKNTSNLNNSALFIDGLCLFEFNKTNDNTTKRILNLKQYKNTIISYEKIFQEYNQTYPNSIFIILIDENNFYPLTLEIESNINKKKQMITNWRNDIRIHIENWSTIIQKPIHCVIAEYSCLEPDNFFSLPNPGMISFAQYIHQLDLRKSRYIYNPENTIDNCIGKNIGLSCVISGKDFFINSRWDIKSKIRKYSKDFSYNFPSFLDIILCPDSIRDNDLFNFSNEIQCGLGRKHKTYFPSISLDDFYTEDEEETNEYLKIFPKPLILDEKILSQPLQQQNNNNINSLQQDINSIQSGSPIYSSAPIINLPKLSEAYVRGYVSQCNFERGMQYHKYDTIFNRRQNAYTLTGMCKGSSAPPYSITVILSSKKQRVRSSKCSCPIGSGKCKHVAAFLLSWVYCRDKFKIQLPDASQIPFSPIPKTPNIHQNSQNENSKDKEEEKEDKEKGDEENNFLSSRPGKRKLPKWMNNDISPTKKFKKNTGKVKNLYKNKQKEKEKEKQTEIIVNIEPNIHINTDNNSQSLQEENNITKPLILRSVKEVLADLDKEFEELNNMEENDLN